MLIVNNNHWSTRRERESCIVVYESDESVKVAGYSNGTTRTNFITGNISDSQFITYMTSKYARLRHADDIIRI